MAGGFWRGESGPRAIGPRLSHFPALRGLEEEWRFTPLKRLGSLVTAGELTGDAPAVTYDSLPVKAKTGSENNITADLCKHQQLRQKK